MQLFVDFSPVIINMIHTPHKGNGEEFYQEMFINHVLLDAFMSLIVEQVTLVIS